MEGEILWGKRKKRLLIAEFRAKKKGLGGKGGVEDV
jgi:hypothetical protein